MKERSDRHEAERRLRWHSAAQNLLGECRCDPKYFNTEGVDPLCVWHRYKDGLTTALRTEYLRGTSDERAQWALKSAVRSG